MQTFFYLEYAIAHKGTDGNSLTVKNIQYIVYCVINIYSVHFIGRLFVQAKLFESIYTLMFAIKYSF